MATDAAYPDKADPAFILLGLLLGTLLYGAILVQVFAYLHSARVGKDRVWIRILVAYLVLLETGMIAFNIYTMFATMVHLLRDAEYYIHGVFNIWDLVLRINTVLTVLISTPVQCSMAWRLRVISCSNVFPALIVLLSLVSFGLGIATLIDGDRVAVNFNIDASLPRPVAISLFVPFSWLTTSAIADTVIAICFIITLSRKRTGVKNTDTLLTRLTHLLVGTGAITALLTVLDAALYYRGAETLFEGMPFVYVVPEMMISKLYTNSLLATLNARIVWRDYLPKQNSVAAKGWSSLPSIKIVQRKVTVTSESSS